MPHPNEYAYQRDALSSIGIRAIMHGDRHIITQDGCTWDIANVNMAHIATLARIIAEATAARDEEAEAQRLGHLYDALDEKDGEGISMRPAMTHAEADIISDGKGDFEPFTQDYDGVEP